MDNFETQSLMIRLFNDDMGWNNSKLGTGELTFGQYEVEDAPPPEDASAPQHKEYRLAEFIKV